MHCQISGTQELTHQVISFCCAEDVSRVPSFNVCDFYVSIAHLLYAQALWRGYRFRQQNDNPKVVKLRQRLRKVSASVREEDKLCNKTASALDYLLRYKHFSDILEALKNLGKASNLASFTSSYSNY